jgi:hypothetical protein
MTTLTAEPASITSGRRLPLFAFVLALIVGLPFLNKPFHIDDTVVLAVAQQIIRHPLRPFDASINWLGDYRPLFTETTNPPLVSYYLAPVVARFGFAEVPLHIAMLAFLIVLAVATAALSRRFARGSAWPVLFVMLSPAVVVSTNVMRDVPLAALSTAAVALFVSGVDRQHWPLALAGSLVAGLAMLAKYSGVVLVPVLALYAIVQGRGRYALWLVAGLALLGLWSLDNQLVHGRTHLAYLMAKRRNEVPWTDRFYAVFVILGSSLFLVPAIVADAARRRQLWLLAATAPAAGLVLFGAWLHNDRAVGWQYVLWVILGGALVFLLAVRGLGAGLRWAWRRQSTAEPECGSPADALFLTLWAGGILAFSVLFVMFGAVRHLIPALVPLALLTSRLLLPVDARSRAFSALLAVLVAVQAIVAFGAATGDYEYAQAYRDFAHRARQRLTRPGREIWFVGSWGWQRYALSAGFTLLGPRGRMPRPGDLLLMPDRVYKGPLPEGLEITQIEEKTYRGRIPIHTMDGSVSASFYSTTGASVPYAFTRERTLETFRVFRVESAPRPAS